jgi:hypothetical protein
MALLSQKRFDFKYYFYIFWSLEEDSSSSSSFLPKTIGKVSLGKKDKNKKVLLRGSAFLLIT